ncbi:MAG TPA: hypothetical protein HA252_02960 [Candidatus Diapherotrites archaeon]|uniref:DNA topoisomerase n=1 Tax=Candidatus Iainarchaeum sp. TaxID=3101447 RepID=A0A7J4JIA5_9ARCH|nr:hypothetical protein [Candidatus Diapherotrites archaeon]
MKVIVSEKAIAGRRIASILAGREVPQSTEGKAPVFLFDKDGEEFVVVPLRGHIVDVDFPKRYSYWLGTDLKQLNNAEIEYVATEKEIAAALKKVGKNAEEAIIATDADREGEAIGVEALRFIQEANPKIRVKKALFSAITPKDIQDAFAQPVEVDHHLADSADSRREIDLIWGAVLTRFISLVSGRLGKEFLSAGRVQTPSVDYADDLVVKSSEGNVSIVKIGAFCERFLDKQKQEIAGCEVYDVKSEGFEAFSFNPLTLTLEFKPLTAVVRHRHEEDLVKVGLETGRWTRITGTHSIFVLRDSKIEIVVGGELREGDLVLAPKCMPSQPAITEIDLPHAFKALPQEVQEKVFITEAFIRKRVSLTDAGRKFLKMARKGAVSAYGCLSSTISQWETGKKKSVSYPLLARYLQALGHGMEWFLASELGMLETPVRQVLSVAEWHANERCAHLGEKAKLCRYDYRWASPLHLPVTKELMRLIGYYLAEGSHAGRNLSLDFGPSENALAADAVNCIAAVFGRTPKIHRKPTSLHINFGGHFGKTLFMDVLKLGENARRKALPSLAFNVADEMKKELLHGYFEGDGNYSTSGQLLCQTASEGLASGLLYLLLQLGILATCSPTTNTSPLPNQPPGGIKPRHGFKVRVSGKHNLERALEIVPARHKERVLAYLQGQTTRCGFDGIPIHETGLSRVWPKLSSNHAQRIGSQALQTLVETKGNRLASIQIQRLQCLAKSDLAFLRVNRVERVKPTTPFVFDVSVEDNENFVGGHGGVILHNTLALIVDREKERKAFNKQKFWVLNAVFEKDRKPFEAEHKSGRFWEKAEAEKAFGVREAKHGKVTKVSSQKRSIAKPIPFNTTGFLRSASAIGFTAGEAMNCAETLYQMGLTSYPRTDNTVYSKNLDLKAVLQELGKCVELSAEVQKILALGRIDPSAGKESKDHPPIHPVSAAQKGKLAERQWKIYELIVRRFLATLSEDAETMNQAVDIDLEGEAFVARGQLILKKGWKEFYPYSQLNEVILPELRERDVVDLKKLDLLEKETEPPARYSQGSLIKLMEDNGLGTKATRHEIIRKLYARAYIHGLKALEPNEIAFSVTEVLEKYAAGLAKPKMTAELENEMDLIAAGKKTKKEVVEDSRRLLLASLEELLKNKADIGLELRKALQADSLFGKCDRCGQLLRKIKSRNNKWFLGCTGYPKCTNTYPLPQNGKITPLSVPCPDCGKPTFRVQGQRYRYEMCVDPACPSKKDWKTKAKKMAADGGGEKPEEEVVTESEKQELEEDLS